MELERVKMRNEELANKSTNNIIFSFYFDSKFWTRNRPGDKMRDRYNLNLLPGMSEDGVEYGMYVCLLHLYFTNH